MSVRTPAISIITPVWNGMPYIQEAVNSVLSQDFQDWELIISDNGSTDTTREYLDQLTDPRIRIFKQEKNLGIDGNLNFLFSKPASDLAYCLCADDYLYPNVLKDVVDEWARCPKDVAVVVFNWKDILTHSIKGKYSYEVLPRVITSSLSQLAFFLFGNFPGNLSNISVRVSSIVKSGGFDEAYRLAGDFEIWARIGLKHSIFLSDIQATHIRRHEGTATNYLNRQGRQFAEQTIIYESLIDRLSSEFNRQKLVDYFNIEICSYHLRESMRNLLHNGRAQYLMLYLNSTSKVFWPKWKRVFFTLPYAMNEKGRMHLLVKMAGEMITANKAKAT